MAAKAIVENKDYDQLIYPFKKEMERTYIHRTMFDKMTDGFIDNIVTAEDNPIVQKILYGTDINWLQYGALSAAPLAMLASKPAIADFHQLSDTHTHIH